MSKIKFIFTFFSALFPALDHSENQRHLGYKQANKNLSIPVALPVRLVVLVVVEIEANRVHHVLNRSNKRHQLIGGEAEQKAHGEEGGEEAPEYEDCKPLSAFVIEPLEGEKHVEKEDSPTDHRAIIGGKENQF